MKGVIAESMRVLPVYSPSDTSKFRMTEELSFAFGTSEMAAASSGAEPTSIRWKRKGRLEQNTLDSVCHDISKKSNETLI